MQREIQLKPEVKQEIIRKIKAYFTTERGEEFGDLAAHLLLNFIMEEISPVFYNQGIQDAIQYINDRVEDLYAFEI